jgi:hypothetical protein
METYICATMNVQMLKAVTVSSRTSARGSDSPIPSDLLQVRMKTQLCTLHGKMMEQWTRDRGLETAEKTLGRQQRRRKRNGGVE